MNSEIQAIYAFLLTGDFHVSEVIREEHNLYAVWLEKPSPWPYDSPECMYSAVFKLEPEDE